MSASFTVALPAPLKRRGEIVGMVCGALCFPFAFFGESLGAMLPDGPPGVILPIVFFAAVAGAVGCLIRGNDAGYVAGCAPRVGIRAGIVATITGGALVVFAATLHAFGIGHPARGGVWLSIFAAVLPRTRPFQILVLVLLGVPPAVFFGMAGALIAAMLRNPPPSAGDGAGVSQRLPQHRSAFFIAVIALSVVGYLSPFTHLFRPAPKPVVTAPVPVMPPPIAPPPPVYVPPKWHYEKPADFDGAEAQRIVVSQQRSLGEIMSELPMALSPDGRRLAWCRNSAPSVLVRIQDIDTLDVLADFSALDEPAELAWSPDSEKLCYTTAKNPRTIGVFEIATKRHSLLPQPKNGRVPEGEMRWWHAEEIVFINSGKAQQSLDLDMLRVRPATDSPRWKALSTEEQNAKLIIAKHLPQTPRWRMDFSMMVSGYAAPAEANPWKTRQALYLTLFDARKSYQTILNLPVRIGDNFVGSPDGSKIIHVRNQQLEIFYCELQPERGLVIPLKMPTAPEAGLAELVEKKSLCLFICAPLINPLNGKTVGPDRDHVKALGRVVTWKDKDAVIAVAEDYSPIQPGDVIADLHAWEASRLKIAGELGRSEWWTAIETIDAATPVPPRDGMAALDRGLTVTADFSHGSVRLNKITLPRTPEPASTSAPPKSPPPELPLEDQYVQLLNNFIFQHHAKSSRGDVNGFVNDYADRIDHFHNGVVNREFVRKDETAYHAPGTIVTERLMGVPHFVRLGGNTFSATYTISFHRIQPDGKWTKGFSDVEMQIELTPAGPRIVRQRGEARNVQKGP